MLRSILVILASLGRLALSKSALEVYEESMKEMSIVMLPSYSENIKFLGVSWWVNYKPKTQPTNSSEQPEYTPLVRLTAVTTEDIFVKKIDKIWFEVDKKDPKATQARPILSTPITNPITSYQMHNNESVLVVAFKNLTILTLNLSHSSDPNKLIISKFDASYIVSEGDEQIRSIGIVPYSDFILFSASRFEFFKINRMTSEVISRKRSFLDEVRFIVAPSPTHRPRYDPHNPHKKEETWLNRRIQKMAESTYFVTTGGGQGINALVDWTSMKVYRYWHILDREGRNMEKTSSKDFVKSITFFGGSPKGHLYAMLGTQIVSKLYFYSGASRYMTECLSLPFLSKEGSVAWVNGTMYLHILQENLLNATDSLAESYFLNAGPFDSRKPQFLMVGSGHWMKTQSFHLANMLTFSTNITKRDADDYMNDVYGDLDSFYFFLSVGANSLFVQVPPFNWDICKEDSYPYYSYRMLYGRYRMCKGKTQHGFHRQTTATQNIIKDQKTAIAYSPRNCALRHQKMHIRTLGINEYRFLCRDKYNLTEPEQELSNDNGCLPGYNLDSYGL